MHPDFPARRRPRPRTGHEQRAGLAGVDLITVEHFNKLARDALQAGNMSVALDHLANAKKAIDRADKMIRTGR